MSYRILPATYALTHLMIAVMRLMSVTERAIVMVMMPCVAVMPVPIVCPTGMCVPPTGVIAPVPWAVPCVPCVTPEPIVDNRSENIYRLYYVVLAIDILIADYLNRNLVVIVFLNIYRGNILEDILRQNRL